jgi:hypothetical protein
MSSRSSIRRTPRRPGPRAAAVVGMLLAGAWFAAPAALAREGDSEFLLYVGSSTVYIDNVPSTGAFFGGRYGYEFFDNLLWTLGGNFGATDGKHTVAGKEYAVSTSTSAVQTGLLYYFGRDGKKWLVPFVGAGVSEISYDVDYRYQGSKVGKTSGTAPGAFAFAGLEMWLARALTLIVSYDVEGYDIKRQTGGSTTLATGGLQIAVRINF